MPRTWRRRFVRPLVLAAAAAAALFVSAAARADDTPDAALAALLQQAHAAAASPGACQRADADRLVRVLCAGRIRVGVRDEYPLFGVRSGMQRHGYEIDVADKIAERLGVAVDFVGVKAANRVPMLADGSIDLVIATMGDNTQRETQVRFVRPHYYRSETVLVGPRELRVADWQDLKDRTVCVTVGNGSNAELVSGGARLMLFDEAMTLVERLNDQTCTLAAQDDSFFAFYFTDPAFAGQFSEKFGFAQIPWGIGVALDNTEMLARAVGLISQVFHRDGTFLAAARANRIGTAFLTEQQAVWSRPDCNTASGGSNPDCILPGANVELEPTRFAGKVSEIEAWFASHAGLELELPMLKTAPAWSLFIGGVLNSLMLIAGALIATLVFALLFGLAMGARWRIVRWPARTVTVALQSSPIILTLVITAAVMHALMPYSRAVAFAAASVALGLSNGSNAGQAISEAYLSLGSERRLRDAGHLKLFFLAISRSATQIVAFLINAAKGTPIASFIGAPELLSALTDITSFSSGRATAYTLLLVFYTAVVIVVVWLCRQLQQRLMRSSAIA